APALNIEYLTLDEYVEAFHAAIAAGQGDAFRRRFQNVDVLLVDDVQFLTNRKEMQSELLRLTEALQGGGHQIVLTSDRPPPETAARPPGGKGRPLAGVGAETSSATSSPTSPLRWGRRSRRGGRGSGKRCCAGRAKAIAPAVSRRCSSGIRRRLWTR